MAFFQYFGKSDTVNINSAMTDKSEQIVKRKTSKIGEKRQEKYIKINNIVKYLPNIFGNLYVIYAYPKLSFTQNLLR